MQTMKRLWQRVPGLFRKIIVSIIGFILVVAGMIMWFIPGPGWGTIILGLMVLQTEFAWAARLKNWIIKRFKAAYEAVKQRKQKKT